MIFYNSQMNGIISISRLFKALNIKFKMRENKKNVSILVELDISSRFLAK